MTKGQARSRAGRPAANRLWLRRSDVTYGPAALVCLAVSVGKSIRLYLADGTPGGLLTAEIMNWTGHVVAAPRSELAGLLKRPEASRTGVYLLLGDDPESLGGSLAYIGEGDDVGKRLYQHARAEDLGGKDFWDRAVVLTSKDANLTKAHARYLESRFITLAMQARRSLLVNGTAPAPLPLPEAPGTEYAGRPLMVEVEIGKGTVFYTSFHNRAQASEQEKVLLELLVLKQIGTSSKTTLAKASQSLGISLRISRTAPTTEPDRCMALMPAPKIVRTKIRI
jgi:hypothetical protein